MKFDPITGEPIEEVTQEVNATDNVTSQPTPVAPQPVLVAPYPMQEPQKKTGVKIGVIVAAAVCVVAIIGLIIALVSGVFMSDKDRVMKAIANTFNEGGALAETYEEYMSYGKEEELTSRTFIEYDGVGVEVEYRHTNEDKQFWGLVDMTGYPELEGTVTITDGQVQASTPFLSDILFVYNYREDNDGYLMDQLSEDEIALINQMFEMIYDLKSTTASNTEVNEDIAKSIEEWYDAIEVEKLEDKEEFEIDGKDKKCTGYRMYITEDTVVGLLEIYEDILAEYDGVTYTVEDTEVSLDEMVDVLIDEVDGMDDIEIDFYLDSNKLAAVVVEVDGEDLEVLFLGGDYRAQNILVEYDGNDMFEIECEMKDEVEELTFKMAGSKFFAYEYDTESGDFEAKIYDYYGDSVINLEGTFVTEKDRFAFEKGEIEIPEEDFKFDFEMSMEKGAEIEELEGDILDIGEASEEELQEALSFFY